ncbi:adenylate/guanylate cyclase domain-containing protein [Sphaerotilus mobilis]|nr:adenylate/guanylate cyclase domain-containing protein [Sphaerotilus mobilis]
MAPEEAAQPEVGKHPWPELVRVRRTVVVVDVVESVRLLREHENDVIQRWRQFVQQVRSDVLPVRNGRMVKSLGDGMLLEFRSVPQAVDAAFELHRLASAFNQGRPQDASIVLRAGVHETDLVVEEYDVFGSGVNLAARLCSVAQPGETILSPQARQALVPDIDADIEDLGDADLPMPDTTARPVRLDLEIEDLGLVNLKHFSERQRAFRAGPIGERMPMWASQGAGHDERIGIAVIPFEDPLATERIQSVLGEVLADDLIAQFARLPQLNVISRLSTTRLRDRSFDAQVLHEVLGCNYAVTGTLTLVGERFRLRVQLVNCPLGEVIWAEGLDGRVAEALDGSSPVVERLGEQIGAAMVGAEVRRAVRLPLPTLDSYTILLGAISQMHLLSPREFGRAREMLSYLCDRHPRSPAPRAWLAKWHVLRVAQGWSEREDDDHQMARLAVSQALDLDGGFSLALAIDGLVHAYLGKDLEQASDRYSQAIQINPNEGLAWLFQSALHAYANDGQDAVRCALQAQRLSPLDPMRYYYDNFTSMALLSHGDYDTAISYGKRSLRANRTHGSTLRILAIAQSLGGHADEAHQTVQDLLRVERGFSVSQYLRRYPGADRPHAVRYAQALREAGLPEN